MIAALAAPAWADQVEVRDASAHRVGETWTVSATLRHPDTGWDHYANGWEILDAKGNRLGFRELLHPHDTEQPFSRALSGVAIPQGTTEVFIRGYCNKDGPSSQRFPLRLDQ